LPWDILGLFLLFAFDKNKKVVSILDPLPIPTLGKNILKTTANNLNLALQVANPAWKDNILKWGCKVPTIPTNSNGYESCQCIIVLIDSFSTRNLTCHTRAVLCRAIWFLI
jgi:hypothetical protein